MCTQKYPTVTFFEGLAVSGKKTKTGFRIRLPSRKVFSASKLILATGIRDIIPAVEGFEFKGENTAIMANGDKAFHLAALVYNLTKDVSIITAGKFTLNTDMFLILFLQLFAIHLKVMSQMITANWMVIQIFLLKKTEFCCHSCPFSY